MTSLRAPGPTSGATSETTSETTSQTTRAMVEAFGAAFDAGDVQAVSALITPDCVFEGTVPPDGDRHVGAGPVLAAFRAVFDGAREAHFTTEETITMGDRAVVRWRYDWVDHDGRPGHVRGVDVFRVRDGRVGEKLAYVKG